MKTLKPSPGIILLLQYHSDFEQRQWQYETSGSVWIKLDSQSEWETMALPEKDAIQKCANTANWSLLGNVCLMDEIQKLNFI